VEVEAVDTSVSAAQEVELMVETAMEPPVQVEEEAQAVAATEAAIITPLRAAVKVLAVHRVVTAAAEEEAGGAAAVLDTTMALVEAGRVLRPT
jgi:hypothetical protein